MFLQFSFNLYILFFGLIEFIKENRRRRNMWSLLAALKDVIEQRKLVLQNKRELKKSDQLLKDAISKHQQASSQQTKAKEETQATEQEVASLQRRIKELQAELNHQDALLQSQKESFEKCKSETENAMENMGIRQSEHEKNQQGYLNQNESLENLVKEKQRGPEKKRRPVNDCDSSEQSTRIHALGDLHGWAPGLIGYLTQHNLAKIEISGEKVYTESEDGKISLNLEAMSNLFPDLAEYLTHSKEKEIAEDETIESFLHAGLLGQKAGTFNPRASYCDIDVEWIATNEFFVQVGDVFDRADHSELSAEILRQMVLQAPAHVFILVGNHEEFLLLDQRGGWLRNEKKWGYEQRRGGNTRSLELINPMGEFDPELDFSVEDFLLDDTYKKYQQSAAVLYFTQYFAQKKLTGNAFDDVSNFSPEELQSFSERILSGTWDAYGAASEFHQIFLERLTSNSCSFPGAIASLGIGNSWFMHAEPNGLRKYLSNLSKEEVLELKTPTRLGDRDLLILLMDAFKSSDGGFTSRCTELFWARDASSGFDALDSRFAHISSEIIKVLPGVRNIIHGHSPVPLNLDRNIPHTYLGRLVGIPVSPESGDIRVYNIDEGMTPVYQYEFEGNKIYEEAMPKGLQVPKILEEYHITGNPVEVDDLWDLSHMFIDEETVPFTVEHELTLNDTPTQYLKSGPGKIRINPNFKDNQPEFVCTGEEKFRGDPTQFSWLNVEEVESLSNPLKGKQPPPDGLYRVQNKIMGGMTLAENLLHLFSIEAFKKKSMAGGYAEYDGKRTHKELENYLGIDRSALWNNLGKSIIFEGINCSTKFFTIQSTSNPAALNLSALNLGKGNFTLIVRNLNLHGGEKTSKTEVKTGSFLTQTITLTAPLSEVEISISDTITGKSTPIFEGIFGSSKHKPIHSTGEAIAKPPVWMLMRNPTPSGPLWNFTKEYKIEHTEKRNLLESKTIKEGTGRTDPPVQRQRVPIQPERKKSPRTVSDKTSNTERPQPEKPAQEVSNKAVVPEKETIPKFDQAESSDVSGTSNESESQQPDDEPKPEPIKDEHETEVKVEEKPPETEETESPDLEKPSKGDKVEPLDDENKTNTPPKPGQKEPGLDKDKKLEVSIDKTTKADVKDPLPALKILERAKERSEKHEAKKGSDTEKS